MVQSFTVPTVVIIPSTSRRIPIPTVTRAAGGTAIAATSPTTTVTPPAVKIDTAAITRTAKKHTIPTTMPKTMRAIPRVTGHSTTAIAIIRISFSVLLVQGLLFPPHLLCFRRHFLTYPVRSFSRNPHGFCLFHQKSAACIFPCNPYIHNRLR